MATDNCLLITKIINLSTVSRILRLLFLLNISSTITQAQNLIANGDFEEENICAEYKQNCAPEAWISSSLESYNYFDDGLHAHEGRHFVGVITGNKEVGAVRTFIRTRLLCRLRKGRQYQLQFYVRSRHPVLDSIGVYFSGTDLLYERKNFTQLMPALIIRDSIKILSGSEIPWIKISLLYTATGEENFMAIGSFKKKEQRYFAPPEIKGNYYLYIDDIRFTPVDPREIICNGADSTKAAIYQDNQRHDVLEKRIAYYKKNTPLEPISGYTIIRKIDTLIIPDVLFATGSAELNEKTFGILDSFCLQLSMRHIDSIQVEGHTDSVGTLVYNNGLSKDRAMAVSSYILKHSAIDSRKLLIHYYAYSKPVATNITSGGRQRNRRVEIFLYTQE